MNTTKSSELFKRARKNIPGGVNSPVRAFGSVGMEPLFIASATGATVTDVDGNVFVDYVGSWGPMILGHAHPEVVTAVKAAAENGLSFGAPCEYEVRMAELLARITTVKMLRMVNSGTEAVMAALRLARGYTGRNKIVKFAGCYHGHTDSMLVKAGSGAMTGVVPDSAGVTPGVAAHTLTAEYNNLDSVEEAFRQHPREIAAVIVEPVAANMGVVLPLPGFLAGLRDLCDAHGALLIFDEVITGFRLAPGGAQQFFGIDADLVTYGKIIGGGMPVGAYGGRPEIMEHIAPVGPVYQAGTLSGNPVAMAAGLAQLLILADNQNLYGNLANACEKLAHGLREAATAAGIPAQVNQIGSLCCCFFSREPVFDYASAKNADTQAYARFFAGMLDRGIYLAPSQFEAMFVGAAHTDALVEQTIAAASDTLRSMA